MRKQSGLTFIEVLVSLVILATGILGAVAMQASAKKGSFDAMQRSIASAYAQDIIERMRSNASDEATLESYQGTYGDDTQNVPENLCNSVANLCNSAEMVLNDLYEWEQLIQGAEVTYKGKNAGGLLDAKGCVEHANNFVTVVVSWQGRTATKDAADTNSTIETNCGTQSDKRRQVVVEGFIY